MGAENLGTSFSKDEENDEGDTRFHTDVCRSTTEDLVKHEWTSLQYSLARSVLDTFMKENYRQCGRCGAKAAKIKSPTFGWLRKVCFLGNFFFPLKKLCIEKDVWKSPIVHSNEFYLGSTMAL